MGTPDLSEFVALTKTRQRKPCTVAAVLGELGKDDAAKLEAAIAATTFGSITVTAVLDWCKARGHEVTQNHVVNHRQRKCACDG